MSSVYINCAAMISAVACLVRPDIQIRTARSGCPPCKRQKRDIARLLDRSGKAALVRRAHSSQAPRHDLAALGDELRQQTHVFVVDRLNLLHAKFADLLAAEIFAATFPATARAASRTRTTRGWAIAGG